MLLIAAALAEELETALNLCRDRTKIRCAGVPIWKATHGGKTLLLVKLGVGPARSAAVLARVLGSVHPSRILLVGYAGALDPELRVGDLVVVDRADLLAGETDGVPLSELSLGGSSPLAAAEELHALAHAAGLPVRRGVALTSASIIGAPAHRRVLFENFHAAIADMETGALARVASAVAIPLCCVRAVSDEAGDDLLAFLSYDPDSSSFRRAAKVLAAGGWRRRYSQWRRQSLAARQSLSRFLTACLKELTIDD